MIKVNLSRLSQASEKLKEERMLVERKTEEVETVYRSLLLASEGLDEHLMELRRTIHLMEENSQSMMRLQGGLEKVCRCYGETERRTVEEAEDARSLLPLKRKIGRIDFRPYLYILQLLLRR